MARIAGINIPLNKHIVIALTAIYGVGDSRARLICNVAGVKPETKVKDLAETEVNDLRQALAKYTVEGDPDTVARNEARRSEGPRRREIMRKGPR